MNNSTRVSWGIVSIGLVGLWSALASVSAIADDTLSGAAVPPCPASYGNPPKALEVNNEQVLHWERTTANQYRDRGHILGTVTKIYPDKNGHDHLQIQIGGHDTDTIELIYNQDFGDMPDPSLGTTVEACGDYITSTDQSGPYPPSPDGAILHWVHMNPSGRGHPPGFVAFGGVVYGQDAEHAGPKRGD